MKRFDTRRFSPPAAVGNIKLQNPRKKSPVKVVEVQLDSGADMTCLPKESIESFSNLTYSMVRVKGYSGESQVCRTYFIDIIFNGYIFKYVQVIPIEDEIGFLGRDILNQLKTVLDGPKLKWQASK